MPIQRPTAKKLVSETEFKLINESFPPLVGTLSDKALRQRMERARKAQVRYHTMVERQRSKQPSGAQNGPTSSANLKEVMSKEKIFEETLARFERQTAKAGSSAGMKAGANTPARTVLGKKTDTKGGAQGTSKASVKMANKAAAKTGSKAAPKAGKGKGGATKTTPRGRHGALTPSTTLH